MRIRSPRHPPRWVFLSRNRLVIGAMSLFLVLYLGLFAHLEDIRQLSVEQNTHHVVDVAERHAQRQQEQQQQQLRVSQRGNGEPVHDGFANKQKKALLQPHLQAVGPERIWSELIQEAAKLKQQGKKPGVAMEVGMHRPVQCLQAATAGLEAHCVEPSPKSFERVKKGVELASPEVRDRVHLYQVAAGGTSGGTVEFTASGGTGDHVGNHDMWAMQAERTTEIKNGGAVIKVPTMRLDEIVENEITSDEGVFVLKVDTQGFEPAVLSGLTESLRQHKVQYLLMEYWPRGIDLLADQKDACVGADLLQSLVDVGYTLYAMGVQAHPKAPQGWKDHLGTRPLDNIRDNCQWYLDLEKKVPSDEYKMGYWSDILAVAPTAELEEPQTGTGLILQQTK